MGNGRGRVVATIPDPPGQLYNLLYDEVRWLHLKWKDYCALFASSPERVMLLNRAAPDFFGNLQRMMWEDVALHLCRLTDPPKSMGHDNLTLQRFPKVISDPKFRSQVQVSVDSAKQKTKFARDWRNRRMAHTELPHSKAKPLEIANLQKIEDALEKIRSVMNCVELHYQDSKVSYHLSVEALGGVESLMRILEKGVKS